MAAAASDVAGDITAMAELRGQVAELDRRIANLLDQVEGGQAVGDRLTKREAERAAAAERLAELAARPRVELLPPLSAREIVCQLRAAWVGGDRETAALALANFVVRVDAGRGLEPVVTLRAPSGQK